MSGLETPARSQRQIVETGRVIHRRYLVQRPLKQGQICAVYQGTDQVLQRMVAIKVVPAPHVPDYKAAMRMTANFSHPNIIGLYDLVEELEALYLVQEYIEGDDFAALLQMPLSPYDVADFGSQLCVALMYAANSSHRACHGDLTPTAVIRDHGGMIRVNNFALPSDLHYFQSWSAIGGDGIAISDSELAWGMPSEGRRDDDTRAVGLLLYQLLTSRAPGITVVEPPRDGRLRFRRDVPPELCETVARAVVRQHPQHISTPEALVTELKKLTEALEPIKPIAAPVSSVPQREEPVIARQLSPAAGGKLATALPARDSELPGPVAPSYRSDQGIKPVTAEVPPASPTVADVSLQLAAARQAAYPEAAKGGSSAFTILLIGLLVFVLLFIVGYFAGQLLIR